MWEKSNLLSVPITALFRDNKEWAVFIANNNIVQKRYVQIGRKNAYHAQISSGIQEGNWYVLHPKDQLADGVKVVSRAEYIIE
ncbi:MAG: HlyD family secretion protein [Paraglaciecola sp.]